MGGAEAVCGCSRSSTASLVCDAMQSRQCASRQHCLLLPLLDHNAARLGKACRHWLGAVQFVRAGIAKLATMATLGPPFQPHSRT